MGMAWFNGSSYSSLLIDIPIEIETNIPTSGHACQLFVVMNLNPVPLICMIHTTITKKTGYLTVLDLADGLYMWNLTASDVDMLFSQI
jgi:hypothetical protein